MVGMAAVESSYQLHTPDTKVTFLGRKVLVLTPLDRRQTQPVHVTAPKRIYQFYHILHKKCSFFKYKLLSKMIEIRT